MEIVNPPGWCQDAIPTTEGWTHPNTGKLLKTYGMSQEQVDEYMSRIGKAVEPADVNEHTHDDGTTHSHADGDKPHTHENEKPAAEPTAPAQASTDSAKRAEDILKLIRSRQAK